ncbi:Hypothetical predicted protein [Olea europaea subsp. europaea]|uniref:Uncharacterized protein n=1 Tax=Olea europaea subsp. europaea TaxID=158383 RepID=A0A8S0TTN0_OLEEU|nr:Hypothetical predicted protein [Olea europaea subsp. europaea]
MNSNAPMPWIGLYAALASLTWTLSLVLDAVISVHSRKLWFPCRYSALNAVSMTALSIAVKLSMDLTTPMKVFTSKLYLEHKYNELRTRISAEELQGGELMDFDKLKSRVKKFWVMAETGNPQFVMARSEASGVLFLICAISYSCNAKMLVDQRKLNIGSSYKWESEDLVIPNEPEHIVGYEQDIRNFVLLLESEAIQDGYLKFVNTSINSCIKMGAKCQPRYLMELMENSTSFEGVLKFESDQVSPIILPEPLNCWSLSVATLTSIIEALPNIHNEKRNRLLKSVIEGFRYVRLLEKDLDVYKKMESSMSAADFAWVLVELRHKWLDMDLQKIARVSKSSKETLKNLANRSEEILKEFTSRMNGNAMESSVNLPENIIIANSMYKICNSLLLVYEESYHSASDTQVFERLSVIVADIFAACLSNLPHVILKKCNNSAIEEREKSIREATHLLGETQGILKALQKLEIPNLSLEQSIYIDEWRTLLKHTNHGISDSTPSSENIVTASSGEVHLDIQELCASAKAEPMETDEGNTESHESGEMAEESREEKENSQE